MSIFLELSRSPMRPRRVFVSEWDVASYAAGWHKNSARPGEIGNVVLSGHHNIEGEVFRYVVDLEPGDKITLYALGCHLAEDDLKQLYLLSFSGHAVADL
ncbi:MAG: hypothetical protein CVU38_12900, partial [Chloroflexi bacterium HGW-Chloroflexi-1]